MSKVRCKSKFQDGRFSSGAGGPVPLWLATVTVWCGVVWCPTDNKALAVVRCGMLPSYPQPGKWRKKKRSSHFSEDLYTEGQIWIFYFGNLRQILKISDIFGN